MKFTCQICGDDFPAIPDAMLEVESGKVVVKNERIPFDIRLLADDIDPDLPSVYGICICLDCQEEMLYASVV